MEGRCIGAPEGILIAGVAWSVVMPLAASPPARLDRLGAMARSQKTTLARVGVSSPLECEGFVALRSTKEPQDWSEKKQASGTTTARSPGWRSASGDIVRAASLRAG